MNLPPRMTPPSEVKRSLSKNFTTRQASNFLSTTLTLDVDHKIGCDKAPRILSGKFVWSILYSTQEFALMLRWHDTLRTVPVKFAVQPQPSYCWRAPTRPIITRPDLARTVADDNDYSSRRIKKERHERPTSRWVHSIAPHLATQRRA